MSEIRKAILTSMGTCDSNEEFISNIKKVIKDIDEDDFVDLTIQNADISNIEINTGMLDKIPQVKAFTFRSCLFHNVLFDKLKKRLRRLTFSDTIIFDTTILQCDLCTGLSSNLTFTPNILEILRSTLHNFSILDSELPDVVISSTSFSCFYKESRDKAPGISTMCNNTFRSIRFYNSSVFADSLKASNNTYHFISLLESRIHSNNNLDFKVSELDTLYDSIFTTNAFNEEVFIGNIEDHLTYYFPKSDTIKITLNFDKIYFNLVNGKKVNPSNKETFTLNEFEEFIIKIYEYPYKNELKALYEYFKLCRNTYLQGEDK